jgi:hypothetical protein
LKPFYRSYPRRLGDNVSRHVFLNLLAGLRTRNQGSGVHLISAVTPPKPRFRTVCKKYASRESPPKKEGFWEKPAKPKSQHQKCLKPVSKRILALGLAKDRCPVEFREGLSGLNGQRPLARGAEIEASPLRRRLLCPRFDRRSESCLAARRADRSRVRKDFHWANVSCGSGSARLGMTHSNSRAVATR